MNYWKLCNDVLSNKHQQMIYPIFKQASVLIKMEG